MKEEQLYGPYLVLHFCFHDLEGPLVRICIEEHLLLEIGQCNRMRATGKSEISFREQQLTYVSRRRNDRRAHVFSAVQQRVFYKEYS